MTDQVVDPTVETAVEPVVNPTDIVTEPAVTVEPTVKEPVSINDYVAVTESITMPEMKYGDMNVDVVIPVEVANLAGEKGVDIQAVSKELYESEDFTLSEATMTGLYDAFGKFQVDTYLASIKAGNDSMVSDYHKGVETKTAEAEKAWEATMEVMGGEDRWTDLESYALANMDDDELSEFNEVMENGTTRMQQLMIKDVFGRFQAAGAPIAPTVLDLEEGQTGGAPGSGDGPLSSADYLKLLTTGEYKKDPKRYDALRRQGMAKGI